MTALALTRDGIVAALRPDPERSIRLLIADYVAEYRNADSVCEDAAVAAARAGRAAWWKRTDYNNALVGIVCGNANLGTPLADLLAYWCEDLPGRRPSDVLAQLIALNVKATVELRDARDRALWDEAGRRNVERVA